jgi:hypothetical protein
VKLRPKCAYLEPGWKDGPVSKSEMIEFGCTVLHLPRLFRRLWWCVTRHRRERMRCVCCCVWGSVCFFFVFSHVREKNQGRRLILGPVLALLPMRGRPECESAILSFVQLYVSEHDVPSAVIERADLLAESLTSADAAVLARATLLLSIVLRAPALQARDVLWSKISPVALVDLFRAADATVRSASVDLFALLAAKPGAAAGLQRDASSFTKLGNALLADQDSLSHDLSRKLTASLAALSTVPEIKVVCFYMFSNLLNIFFFSIFQSMLLLLGRFVRVCWLVCRLLVKERW